MTVQGGIFSCKKPANGEEEIYAPISVIYGEVQDLFMEIVPNVGLFIQFLVGDPCEGLLRTAERSR
jgi:hypothetical protein